MSVHCFKVSLAVTVMNKSLTVTQFVVEVRYLEFALNTIVIRQLIQILACFRTRYEV